MEKFDINEINKKMKELDNRKRLLNELLENRRKLIDKDQETLMGEGKKIHQMWMI